jgi:hypothetical protein
MKIIPNYTFETAPPPKVVVIPAQGGSTEAMLEWIRSVTKATDVTMSVCTGAFVLAKTGLLSGKSATTFHDAFAGFEMQFPDIHLKRGARFVEDGNLASSGRLTSGMDLAFRVVALLRQPSSREDCILAGVPGQRLARPELERDLRPQSGRHSRWPPALPGVHNGRGPKNLIRLQRQDLLFLYAGSQAGFRWKPRQIRQLEPKGPCFAQ